MTAATAIAAIPTVISSHTKFHLYDLVKIKDNGWYECYSTAEDWSYHNHGVNPPVPTLLQFKEGKRLVYLQKPSLNQGAFKFYNRKPKEVLTFPNGNKIAVYEKRTQPEYSTSVGDITIYWFAFDLNTNKFLSFRVGSCWRSDGDIYPSMIQGIKEQYGSVA